MLRSSATGAIVVTLGAAGVLGAMVIRGHPSRSPAESDQAVRGRPVEPRHVAQVAATPAARPDSVIVKPVSTNSSVSAGNVAIAPAAPKPAPRAALAPVLPEGRSDLADGVSAMRSDNVVVLSFDTKLARTRIPEKFERFVRATLPAIYGAPADSALARIPEGGLARQGGLLDELPTRGMRIPMPSGGMITLYPMTRPGQDGPLVTQYRVTTVKG